jgi:RNA polymerase-binding transcription factor DksA
MNKSDLDHFREKLLTEKKSLEAELAQVGQKNGNDNGNGNDWEATAKDIEVDSADENEVADKFEELEENKGIVSQLESQLTEVNAALARIENGTYGICETCGKSIEKERLEANPSARNSIKHEHKLSTAK